MRGIPVLEAGGGQGPETQRTGENTAKMPHRRQEILCGGAIPLIVAGGKGCALPCHEGRVGEDGKGSAVNRSGSAQGSRTGTGIHFKEWIESKAGISVNTCGRRHRQEHWKDQ